MVKKPVDITLQVESIRFKRNGEGNGAIFVGRVVDKRGVQTGDEVVVRCPGNVLHPRAEVFRGEVWVISGFLEAYKGQSQIGAFRAILKRPTGENIIAAIAFNPKFKSIGHQKARELWATFGPDLYEILDNDKPNIEALCQVLTVEAAETLIRVWKEEYSGEFHHWMEENHIPASIGKKLQEFYGKDARSALERDPYRVIAFGQPWRRVDEMARHLGITEGDPRRQHAAVATALYQHFANGHTAMTTGLLTRQVSRLLGGNNRAEEQELACDALRHTYKDGAFVQTGDLWQATGIFLLEAFVAERIRRLVVSSHVEQGHLFDTVILETISSFEEKHHPLSNEQRSAVLLALKCKCCVITGGAGVGKTSVLRCLYDVIEALDGHVLQMALSGRAAKRMEEASGRPARTIAGFLHNIKHEDLSKITHVIIDESSMLDVVSAFQILKKLPDKVSLIFVGDPSQLPPIGAGLILHVLAEGNVVPTARLTKVYRQSGDSGIPAVVDAVRNGDWPPISEYRGRGIGVFKLHARPEEILDRLVEIYENLGGPDAPEDVQILCSIKAANSYGVVGINRAFHCRYTDGENSVMVRSQTGVYKDSGFRQGDKILVTKNQWEKGLFNGSLGRITQAFETPLPLDDGRHAVARAVIDGKELCLAQEDLEWIAHAYAISVHKAQGSQFERVIIPVCKSRLLDRTLIYTAITRGVDQVVLLGDLSAARSAIQSTPHAWLRQIGLTILIHQSMRKAR
jgi:exodeoxyribonuclease V alpha subunit